MSKLPPSKGQMDTSCILCYKEGSIASSRPLGGQGQHVPYLVLGWLIYQMTQAAFRKGFPWLQLISRSQLYPLAVTLAGGYSSLTFRTFPSANEAHGNPAACSPSTAELRSRYLWHKCWIVADTKIFLKLFCRMCSEFIATLMLKPCFSLVTPSQGLDTGRYKEDQLLQDAGLLWQRMLAQGLLTNPAKCSASCAAMSLFPPLSLFPLSQGSPFLMFSQVSLPLQLLLSPPESFPLINLLHFYICLASASVRTWTTVSSTGMRPRCYSPDPLSR